MTPLLALLLAPTAAAATVEVCAVGCTFKKIGLALATNPDEIVLRNERYAEAIDLGGRTVRIRSKDPEKPATLACGNAAVGLSVLVSFDADATLEHLRIEACENERGAVVSNGSKATFRGVTFGPASVTVHGGQLYVEGGSDVTVEGSVFEPASATNGGQIAAIGGSKLSVRDSRFEGGNAIEGAAIWVYETTSVAIERSVFFDGTALGYGGAIKADRAGSLLVDASIFEGGDATKGGALFVAYTDATVTRSRFCENAADYGGGAYVYSNGNTQRQRWTYNVFLRNTGPADGGAVLVNGTSSFELYNNTLAANTGPGLSGLHAAGVSFAQGSYARFDARNNLFVGHEPAYAVFTTSGASGNVLSHTWAWQNASPPWPTWDPGVSGGSNRFTDPKLAASAFDACDAPVWPLRVSPLWEAGDASLDAGIGAFTKKNGPPDADLDGHAAPDDCDDYDPKIRPGALDLCDTIDQDCDGDPLGRDAPEFFADGDGDGYGRGLGLRACLRPSGYAERGGDCNDGDEAIHPGATEVCNGVDDDCDGAVDDGAPPGTWYYDRDEDGYGGEAVLACVQPTGTTARGGDCDDTRALAFPGADEACNGLDDDCDGTVDDGAPFGSWYPDGDGDGVGAGDAVEACTAPTGHVGGDGDCDDGDVDVHPGAAELCDGIDNDCSGAVDDGVDRPEPWYADGDGDGYGDSGDTITACSPPSGYVAIPGDCADLLDSVHPGAVEVCNGMDDDCDGATDEDLARAVYYRDNDGDGVGATSDTYEGCAAPEGFVDTHGDCVDTDPTIHPDAPELCNERDDDCDDLRDEDAEGAVPFYADADHDGFGDPHLEVWACEAPSGFVPGRTDCDDADPTRHPEAFEAANTGIDADCDGLVARSALTGGGGFSCASVDPRGGVGALGLAALATLRRPRRR